MFRFDEFSYYLYEGVEVRVNGVLAGVKVLNSSAIFVRVMVKSVRITVEIVNVVNYIRSGGFVISSLKKKLAS